MKQLIIIGTGGHAGVAIDIALDLGYEIIGLVDDYVAPGESRYNYEIIGNTSLALLGKIPTFIAVGDNRGRFEVFKKINQFCPKFINLVSPAATVARSATMGSGVMICNGAVICSNSYVGNFSIMNTNSGLDHDSRLGEFSHMAPDSVTGGRVIIMNHCLIGIGATVRDGIVVGNNSVVGMGSNVVKSVPENSVEFGNPSKIHDHRKP